MVLIPQQNKPGIRLTLAAGHPDAKGLFLQPGAEVANICWFESEKEDMIAYLRAIQRKERNHRVVQIKPDLSVEMIPPAIQQAAMFEGPGAANDELLKIFPQMHKIQSSRYENAVSKKYHHHHVMTLEGLRQFAETGRLSDHPWMLRPFTQQQVLTILDNLLDKIRSSRYYHLYILKNQAMKLGEAVWYEGEGVFLMLPHMDYQMDKNKTELRIRDRGFESFFSGFLIKHLLADAAYSEWESETMLQKLADECRERCAR